METLSLDPNKIIMNSTDYRNKFQEIDGTKDLDPIAHAILEELIDNNFPQEVKVGRNVNPDLEVRYGLSRDEILNVAAMRTGNFGYELVGRDAAKYFRRFKIAEKGPHGGFVMPAKYLPRIYR